MKRTDKEQLVSELHSKMTGATALYFTDFTGLNVKRMTELRRRLRKLSKDAGASEPDALGDALMLLLEGGCYTLSTFSGASGPIASMAKAARALISIHLRPSRAAE